MWGVQRRLHRWGRYWCIAASVLLVSCGGGLGSDNSDTQPTSPPANVIAPDDFSANEQTLVLLTATGRGQSQSLTYSWQATPTLSITHTDTSLPAASFTAPTTTSISTYRLTVSVTDSLGNSASDEVVITIVPVNQAPVAVIDVSQLSGFDPDTFPAGSTVQLSGAGSLDADAPTGKAAIAHFQWQQTSGPDITAGISMNSETLEFIAPVRDPASLLTLLLTVTDQEGAQASASVSLNILAATDMLPTLSAGQEQRVHSGNIIVLRGEAASANPLAYPLSYQWLNDSQLKPTIVTANALSTYAVAPEVSATTQATFTLRVTDSYGNQVDDSINVSVVPQKLARINDTGVSTRSDNNNIFAVPVNDFPGQDGDIGRDSAAQQNMLDKAGRGVAGFDFTRLDSLGDEVDDTSQTWRCVRDNLTGLIWEVKQPGDSLQDVQFTYSWYQTSNTGGDNGTQDGITASCGISSCDTSSYVAAINLAGLCGYYDWRMPTTEELLSIVHFGQSTAPLLDQTYFPNSVSGTPASAWYWSSESSADGINLVAQNAWAVDVMRGNDNFLNKGTAAFVRLVRGGR